MNLYLINYQSQIRLINLMIIINLSYYLKNHFKIILINLPCSNLTTYLVFQFLFFIFLKINQFNCNVHYYLTKEFKTFAFTTYGDDFQISCNSEQYDVLNLTINKICFLSIFFSTWNICISSTINTKIKIILTKLMIK